MTVLLVVLASAAVVRAWQAGATRTVAVEDGWSYTDVNAAALDGMLARKIFGFSGFRVVEVKAAAVEVAGRPEVLGIAESAGGLLDPIG